MAGFRGNVVLALFVVLGTTSSAHAWWGWRGWGHGPGYYGYYGAAYYSSAYYAPAYYYYPAFPVCSSILPVAPPAMAPAKKLAETVPIPTTKEPPVQKPMKKGPTVTEARSGGFAAASASAGERCKVGFWNVTGRDITLKIDGEPRLLPKDRAVTLELGRSFSWQVDQDQATTERVPADQPFHEVILRQ